MDVESYSSVEELIATLLARNNLPGLKSPPVLEEAHNPMGMASSTRSVKLELLDDSVLNLFVKIRAEGSQAEQFDRVFSLFARERLMYGTILPILSQFQAENTRNDSEFLVEAMFPKYYGGGLVNKDMFLVFENVLQETGRYVTNKTDFHTEDQILLCLRQLAVFHSVSFCFKLKSKMDFLKEFPLLAEPVFSPDRCDHIRSYFQGMFEKHLKIIAVVRNEYVNKNETVLANIDRICSEEDLHELTEKAGRLMEAVYDLIQPEEALSVITHGDFHMWNIAFQGRSPAHQAIFFDLQSSRFSSGVTDIVQYLVQVTTPGQRKLSLQEYLSAYSQSFRSSCQSLGLSPDQSVSSPAWLTSHCSRLSLWGLMYGQCVLPRFVENSERFSEMDRALQEEDHLEVVNIITECGPRMWWVVQLLVDMIIEYKELVK